ncbi:energy-coupled thiamine transporter ThiT [Sedimentibacter sp. zth1]|uniref:energy-coupled thiamine transporter ThiT n=1 Tax=Sedimentibacter sp. zth1 TaxID=2816908 RepID=UPI001A933AC6|nr:energy-coupled thiamine transporter ThiT [Sedimentibacter sp. zth1]QSX06294.1 energy-coupled thiamine transporter ThiT [Sedimentibacter sp. zth1]
MSELLQNFVESTIGQIVIVVVMFALLAIIAISSKQKKFDVKIMTKTAILITIAYVLNQITLFRMPQGGSITPFSMLVIVLIGYLFGARQGILAGITFGLLDLLINPYVVHPVQLFLEYPLAFGALGIGALLRNQNHGLIKSYILGIFGRYVMAFLSGAIFFGEYAPEGFNAVTWSLYYNIGYIGVEGIITIIILLIPGLVKFFDRFKVSNV